MTKASDTQVGGDHYKTMGDFQPWDVLKHWLTPEEYRGYQKGVAIAYLARERQKGGDQDIAKAAHHLQKLVEVLSDGEPIASESQALRDDSPCCGMPNTCEIPCFHHRAQPKPDADGWIDWAGGECPVPAGTMVRVRLRNGYVAEGRALQNICMLEQQWRIGYEHDPTPCGEDIIAYRIINPTT